LRDGVVVDEFATGLVDEGESEGGHEEEWVFYFVESGSEALFTTEGILHELEKLGMDVENGLDVEFGILGQRTQTINTVEGRRVITLIAASLLVAIVAVPISETCLKKNSCVDVNAFGMSRTRSWSIRRSIHGKDR
jgi:hypothetical protein